MTRWRKIQKVQNNSLCSTRFLETSIFNNWLSVSSVGWSIPVWAGQLQCGLVNSGVGWSTGGFRYIGGSMNGGVIQCRVFISKDWSSSLSLEIHPGWPPRLHPCLLRQSSPRKLGVVSDFRCSIGQWLDNTLMLLKPTSHFTWSSSSVRFSPSSLATLLRLVKVIWPVSSSSKSLNAWSRPVNSHCYVAVCL